LEWAPKRKTSGEYNSKGYGPKKKEGISLVKEPLNWFVWERTRNNNKEGPTNPQEKKGFPEIFEVKELRRAFTKVNPGG